MKKTVLILTALMTLTSALCFAKPDKELPPPLMPESTAKPGEGGGAGMKAFGDKLIRELKDGLTRIDEEVEKYGPKEITGKIKVKGKGEKRQILLVTSDKQIYSLKTMNDSRDSTEKLSLTKGKKVTVKGVLNSETNVLTVVSYTLCE